MEPLAYKYVYPLFFAFGGLGLVALAVCSLVMSENIRERGGVFFLLMVVFFFPPWLCAVLPDILGWIRIGNAYYLQYISICLGVTSFLFLGIASYENTHGKNHSARVSTIISGGGIFLAWLILMPQVLTNLLLLWTNIKSTAQL